MKFKVIKPVDIDIKYLDVYVGDRVYAEDVNIGDKEYEELDDLFNDYPMLKGNCGYGATIYLRINVENGHVENWPNNITGDFNDVKVVDEGVYKLLNNELDELIKFEGYVPDCLAINNAGYGDYFEFNIDNDGFIEDWEFTQNDVNYFYEVNE